MKLLLSTSNEDKTHELKSLLEPLGHTVYTLKDYGLKIRVEAKGITFFQNALLKAQAVSKVVDIPVLGDESGLVVPALNGEPGVYSARYAGDGHDDEANIVKLLKNMRDVPEGERSAHFECAIVCAFPDGSEICARGRCDGEILYEKHGKGGFGYDPVFGVACGKSFGELSPEEKDRISHRGKALRELVTLLEAKEKA